MRLRRPMFAMLLFVYAMASDGSDAMGACKETSRRGECAAAANASGSEDATGFVQQPPRGISLLQKHYSAEIFGAAGQWSMPPRWPDFCYDHANDLWGHFCGRWDQSVRLGAISNGARVCCDSLPPPCRRPRVNCNNMDDCFVPSCSQEVWYLSVMEHETEEAFSLFEQDAKQFQDCVFHLRSSACGAKDAKFGSTDSSEAALATFITLDTSDLEATAWLVVKEFSSIHGPRSMLQEGEAAPFDREAYERSLLSRRGAQSELSRGSNALAGRVKLDRTAVKKDDI
eukprot:CAMPEP_0117509894 /NCGR_PEP_ID=MMETSP0784-20121206/27711_1 /TAXON_ID=39447 /ORGANISM="" /LENGTH=284 /DNA_ID=CAMNT_0005305517 /DNA_START=14 /DNA_END=868 /DNA_ORIENTATION=-